MVEQKWGKKRICLSCGARFYDMLRSPIICPKCETEFQPIVSGRGSRAKAAVPVPAPDPVQPLVEEKETLGDKNEGMTCADGRDRHKRSIN